MIVEKSLGFEKADVDRLQSIGRKHAKESEGYTDMLYRVYNDPSLNDDERDYLLYQGGVNIAFAEYMANRLEVDHMAKLIQEAANE